MIRILFQIVTERVWEDALIVDVITRNFWAGNGLTHQTAEEPIQSFSSVIWMLFSLTGNVLGSGIFLLKVISLLATVATIWLACEILRKWQVPTPGIILVLGFLSFEQIHVSFGMAAMESQFATAFLLLGIWSLVSRKRTLLMLTATLAPLVRPELAFWTFVVGLIFILKPRLFSFRALVICIVPTGMWLLFAWSYFGTVIPQTITAKSLIGTTNLSRSGLFNGLNESFESWERFAPFFSNYFTSNALFSRTAAMVVVVILVVLFILGTVRIGRLSLTWAVPALLVPLFVLYVGFFNVSNYHMWYVPPFSAVLVLYAGAAFSYAPKIFPGLKYAVSALILFMYLIPTISYFQYEAYVQKEIDIGVRQLTGIKLDSLMSSEQTVVLEPLGYVGSEISNGQIIDFPGLASRRMTTTLSKLPIGERSMGKGASGIEPDFIVVRQDEWQSFQPQLVPELLQYKLVATIGQRASENLSFPWATYSNADRYFEIYAKDPNLH